jgi:hypothetical protein
MTPPVGNADFQTKMASHRAPTTPAGCIGNASPELSFLFKFVGIGSGPDLVPTGSRKMKKLMLVASRLIRLRKDGQTWTDRSSDKMADALAHLAGLLPISTMPGAERRVAVPVRVETRRRQGPSGRNIGRNT